MPNSGAIVVIHKSFILVTILYVVDIPKTDGPIIMVGPISTNPYQSVHLIFKILPPTYQKIIIEQKEE